MGKFRHGLTELSAHDRIRAGCYSLMFLFQLCRELLLHLRSANHSCSMQYFQIFVGYFSEKKKAT